MALAKLASRRALRGLAPLAAIVLGVMLSGCALSLQTLPKITGSSGATYPLRAVFANVLNLPDEAQVRVGAQVIGQVGTISTKNFQADLTLNIKDSVHIPVGTTAQVRFDNPLGDEYILLHEPSSPALSSSNSSGSSTGSSSGGYLKPNAVIPESDTSTAPSVEDTFAALSLVLNGGGINQLQTIIHELNDTFNGNQPQIRSFITTIDRAFISLNGGKTSIDNALASIADLSKKLNGGGKTIATGIGTLSPAIGVLAGENTQISKLITQLSNLGTIGSRVANESGENSVNDVRALLPVVQQLESVSSQLGPDLGVLSSFEAESQKVAPGDYLQANVIANVYLPAGAYEPTVGTAGADASPAKSSDTVTTGSSAVSSLLGSGLL